MPARYLAQVMSQRCCLVKPKRVTFRRELGAYDLGNMHLLDGESFYTPSCATRSNPTCCARWGENWFHEFDSKSTISSQRRIKRKKEKKGTYFQPELSGQRCEGGGFAWLIPFSCRCSQAHQQRGLTPHRANELETARSDHSIRRLAVVPDRSHSHWAFSWSKGSRETGRVGENNRKQVLHMLVFLQLISWMYRPKASGSQ